MKHDVLEHSTNLHVHYFISYIPRTVRGSNPGRGEVFRTRPDRPWGPPNLLYNGYLVFLGGKAAGAWRSPPTPSSAEVKEKVQLYLHSPSGPSWPVLGLTLPLPFTFYLLPYRAPCSTPHLYFQTFVRSLYFFLTLNPLTWKIW